MEPTFTLAAQPNTDIWKKPPSHDVFTAPFRPHTIAPLPHFRSTTLTFRTRYTQKFDQAGLLLVFTKPTAPDTPRKWIKAGVEFFQGRPRLSTVCCDSWADWSVAPIYPTAEDADEKAVTAGDKAVTILVQREDDDAGSGVWVYQLRDDGTKVPMREIAWVFADNAGEGWEMEVSALVARPSKDTTEALEATFDEFDVKWESP